MNFIVGLSFFHKNMDILESSKFSYKTLQANLWNINNFFKKLLLQVKYIYLITIDELKNNSYMNDVINNDWITLFFYKQNFYSKCLLIYINNGFLAKINSKYNYFLILLRLKYTYKFLNNLLIIKYKLWQI